MRTEAEIRERLKNAQVGVLRSTAMLRDLTGSGHYGAKAFDGSTAGLVAGTARAAGFAEGLAWVLGEPPHDEVAAAKALQKIIERHMDRAEKEDRRA